MHIYLSYAIAKIINIDLKNFLYQIDLKIEIVSLWPVDAFRLLAILS